MSQIYDVIVVGDYCLDLIFTGLSKVPELGTEIFGTGFEMIPGGPYNTTVALHRLGLCVGWASCFGNDEFSRYVVDRARAEGLDDKLFTYLERPLRRITVAASYPHERAFITYYDPDPTIPAAMNALATRLSRVIYLPGLYHGPAFDAGLLIVRAKKMKLVMDGNSEESATIQDPSVKKSIQSCQLFMPNASEARRLTEENELEKAARSLAQICPLVVVKDGADGAYACWKDQLIHDPGIAVKSVDTTGAGDCFNAGFIKAWLQDKPIQECLRWGNVAGGLSTLALGGTGKVICENDIRAWLNSQ